MATAHLQKAAQNIFNHYSRFSMGNDVADYNNDGQPDLITVICCRADEKTLKTYGNGEHLDIYNQKIITQWLSKPVFKKLPAKK